MSEQEPTQEEVIEAIYGTAAEAMAGGASDQQVRDMLVEQGLDQQTASKVVSDLVQMRGEAVRDAGKKNMIYGAPKTIRNGYGNAIIVALITFKWRKLQQAGSILIISNSSKRWEIAS